MAKKERSKKKAGVRKLETVGTKRQVYQRTRSRTAGGLTRSDLMKNKLGHVVSKKKHKLGEHNNWAKCVVKARKELKLEGFVVLNKGEKGKALFKLAQAIAKKKKAVKKTGSKKKNSKKTPPTKKPVRKKTTRAPWVVKKTGAKKRTTKKKATKKIKKVQPKKVNDQKKATKKIKKVQPKKVNDQKGLPKASTGGRKVSMTVKAVVKKSSSIGQSTGSPAETTDSKFDAADMSATANDETPPVASPVDTADQKKCPKCNIQ